MKPSLLFLSVALFAISGCDTYQISEQEYPHAKAWPLATIAQIKNLEVLPDSLNLIAYVTIKYRPKDGDNAFGGAFIELSEIRNTTVYAEHPKLIMLDYPHEIEVGKEYILSIRIVSSPASSLGYELFLAGFDPNE